MTTLEITPKISDKSARFRGTVAAGEHVAVTIKGGAEWLGDDNGAHLSLRVIDFVTGRTLALFPRPEETLEDGDEPDAWSVSAEDPDDLFCNLNLNTDRMVNAARHMLHVPVLFVMGAKDDENPATTRTLYFRDRYGVEFWPERVGDDTPYDLDRWPKQINEWTELVAEFGTRLTTAETNISQAESRVNAAINTIPQTVATAVAQSNSGKADKVANATGGNLAALDANGNLDDSGKKPSDFADAAQFTNHKNNADIHFTAAERAKLNGVAAGAQVNVIETVKRNGVALPVANKAVNITVPTKTSDLQNDGDGNSQFATTRALNNEASRAQTIESELRTDVTSAQSAILDRYTKAETNALVSGAVSGMFVVAQSLPATGESNKIYLVPKSGGETGDVRDEYVWVNGAWEIIGSTRVDLSDYYDKTAADGRFVQKETGKGLVAVDATLATHGAAADAKAVGDALRGGFTKWVCNEISDGWTFESCVFGLITPRVGFGWKVNVTRGSDMAYLNWSESEAGRDALYLEQAASGGRPGIKLSRHLITPTKTSQLTNDGDGANAFVKTNDTRLSDARTPTEHTHAIADVTGLGAALALKADAASLPYALVTVTPTAGAPFVLAACFPISYEFDTTYTDTDMEHARLIWDEASAKWIFQSQTANLEASPPLYESICSFNSDGTFYEALADNLTFGDPATPPTGSTQVLGFTPTYALADRAINAVSLTADATLELPAQTTGKARDFVVRLTLTETNDVVPSVTFPADVAYETDDGEWPDLTEAGTYIVRLTEVPKASESETARFFLQCSSAVADAEPPSAGGGV